MNDDLNIPKALGIAWNAAKHDVKSQKIYDLLLRVDNILALNIEAEEKKEAVAAPLDEEIKMMIEQRNEARKNKDYALADRIRNELKEKGVMIEDTAEGTKYKLI